MEQESVGTDLVGQIAGLTSLRDVDLLELSLLKSIFSIVMPVQVSLVTVDHQNTIQKQVDYSASKHGTVSSQMEASEAFLQACEQLDFSSKEYCTVAFKNHSLTLFLLAQARRVAHYVTIESHNFGITKQHCQQILGMLKIFRNFRELLKESQTDELTGLSNRKAFESVAKKVHEAIMPPSESILGDKRQDSDNGSFWLSMIDIDFFKKINDNHGHLMGDEVLVRVAQTLQTSLRGNDFLFRYGGEEFAIIARAKEKEHIGLTMERLRRTIENISIPQIGPISISIGVTEMQKDVFYMSIIEQADKALYESKSNGRNQVTFYNPTSARANTISVNSDVELF